MNEKEQYSVTEAAAALGYSRGWIMHEIKAGNIEAEMVGHYWVIPASAVDGYERRPRGRQKAEPAVDLLPVPTPEAEQE